MEEKFDATDLSGLIKRFSPDQTKKALRIALQIVSQELRDRVSANTPVYKPQSPDVRPKNQQHPPGLLKESWTQPEEIGELFLSFRNPQPYASILEEGTFPLEMVVAVRRDLTPGRLIVKEGGVFSRMTNDMMGGPIASPVLTDRELHERIVKTVVRQVAAGLGEVS